MSVGVSDRSDRSTGRRSIRDAALDAAAAVVVARGWDGLQMRAVAGETGVSRQTLYNTFGGKDGLARALTVRTTGEFLDGVETALRAHHDPRAALRAAVAFTLRKAADDPLFAAFLVRENSDAFLPLLTSDGEPVVAAARDRIAGTLAASHPDLRRDVLAVCGETVTRLTLSHIVLPLHPAETVADQIAGVGAGILGRDAGALSGAGS